jgi:hypothetical protein
MKIVETQNLQVCFLTTALSLKKMNAGRAIFIPFNRLSWKYENCSE